MKKILFAALALLLSAGFAQAQSLHRHDYHKNARAIQKQQQKRIAQGVRSGQLTPREAARLEHQQARIRYQKRMARADARVTPREYARIKKHQRMASRQIYMKKHNGQLKKHNGQQVEKYRRLQER